jgi:hypothetical protein
MIPSQPERRTGFEAYTKFLTISNVCLLIAAVLMAVTAVVFFCAGYLFNDSGHVPEAVAPFVHSLLLNSLLAVMFFFWQRKVRKQLIAMLPSARKSMLSLGIAYLIVAIANLFQLYLLSLPLAALGIWWIVVSSRSSTRAAFENPQPASETLPPAG